MHTAIPTQLPPSLKLLTRSRLLGTDQFADKSRICSEKATFSSCNPRIALANMRSGPWSSERHTKSRFSRKSGFDPGLKPKDVVPWVRAIASACVRVGYGVVFGVRQGWNSGRVPHSKSIGRRVTCLTFSREMGSFRAYFHRLAERHFSDLFCIQNSLQSLSWFHGIWPGESKCWIRTQRENPPELC